MLRTSKCFPVCPRLRTFSHNSFKCHWCSLRQLFANAAIAASPDAALMEREAAARNDQAARPVTLRTDCEQQHSVQAGRSMSVIPEDFRRSGKEKFRKKAPHPSMTLEFGVSLIGLAAEAAGRSRMDPLFEITAIAGSTTTLGCTQTLRLPAASSFDGRIAAPTFRGPGRNVCGRRLPRPAQRCADGERPVWQARAAARCLSNNL
jgi:hypothetical protein